MFGEKQKEEKMTTFNKVLNTRPQEIKLTSIQKAIDECNNGVSCYKTGCQYAPNNTDACPLIKAHMTRREYCRENNIPIERW